MSKNIDGEAFRYEVIHPNNSLDIKLQFSIDTGSIINKHFHNWIEVVYIVRGSLDFWNDGKTYHLSENDFIMINPMSIHSTSCVDGNTAILLQIPLDYLKQILPEVANLRFYIDYDSSDTRVQSKLIKIREIMKDLWIAYQFQVIGYQFRCYSILFELIYLLVHSFSYEITNSGKTRTEKNLFRIQAVMDYVHEHYAKEITLKMIADEVGLNPVYFSRFFKEQMGCTFLEYLNSIRLEHIYQMMMNTDLPLKNILEQNGMFNYKLFMRMFKKLYGNTPREIRKQKKSE